MFNELRRTQSSPMQSIQRRVDKYGTEDQHWQKLFHSSKKEKSSECTTRPDLHLDLYNFEDPASQQSMYVLTSPRSLEACSQFGIKPVELLHKSFEEFVEEFKSLYDTDFSHQAVCEVFSEQERQRLRKLKLCRDERERMIRERETVSGLIDDNRKNMKTSVRSPDHGYDIAEKELERWDGWRSSDSKKHNKYDIVDDRGKENMFILDDKSQKPLRRKIKYSSGTKSCSPVSPRGGVVTRGESSQSEGRTGGKERPFSASIGRSLHEDAPRASKNHLNPSAYGGTVHQRIRRAASLDGQDVLRAVPQSTSDKRTLSEKDQRIVNLMMSRHNDEERARKDRLMLELELNEQKKLEEQLRQARHRQKQATLYEDFKARDAKQYEVRVRRLRNEQRLKQDKVEMLMSKDLAWQEERRKQEQIKGNKLLAKKIKDSEKKQKQEDNLWQKKREDELQRNMTQLNLLEKHKNAIMKKNFFSTQESMNARSRNRTIRNRHRDIRKGILQQLRQEDENLQHEVAIKHQTALMNYQRQLSRKDNQITQSKLKREERFERQQEQLKKRNSDMEQWKKELTLFRKEKDERARDTVTMAMASKQQRVKSQLEAEKDDHQHNMKKVKEAVEEKKREIQEVIEIKDERSKMVNTEKDEIRRLNRDAARTSQAVRDLVREQTLRSSFDRMAEAAHRQALVGRGPQTGHKNKSTVKLG
ncbi:coiled-coil domain-containing protein 177-like isoform X2 [Montipora capricornis]|uniref:coiled-coil domain-containing protein 177-like isoform X2 n=1 Tax=Montipora capricornis TaxID=246305 RepID=UPI0035F1487D